MKKKKKYNNLKYQELLYSIKKYSNYVPLYNIFFEKIIFFTFELNFNTYNDEKNDIIYERTYDY